MPSATRIPSRSAIRQEMNASRFDLRLLRRHWLRGTITRDLRAEGICLNLRRVRDV